MTSAPNNKWILIDTPTRIPAPGGKLIEEHFGRVRTEDARFSMARMVAPPGWSEPAQTPEFGELTIMLRGRMQIDVGEETIELLAGQSFWVEPRVRVRYANPFEEEAEYFALCLPAFAPDLVHREAEE